MRSILNVELVVLLDWMVESRRPTLEACLARPLQSDGVLAGSIVVTLHSAADGTVTVDALEPKASGEGLGAVAGCVRDQVASWSMPWATPEGKVTVKATFQASRR